MNFLRSQSDMESGRIRTTMPRMIPSGGGGHLAANRDLLARTPAMTKDMLNKLQNAEIGPQKATLCGYNCNIRQISVLIALIILFVFSSSLAYIFFCTSMFRELILQNLVISNSSANFDVFTNPSPSYIKMYIYNYTNVYEVATRQDKKLKVQELGPFTYEDRLTRVNVKFSDDGSTVSYQEKREYKFKIDESKGHMQTDKVTVPNIPMLSGAAMFRRSYFLTRLGMSTLFKQLNAEPFLQVSADRFFFGYDDDLFSLARSMMALSKPYPFEKFGVLANRKGINSEVIEVYTGKDDINKVGLIKTINGKEFMGHHYNEDCDNVHGVDGFLFSPDDIRSRSKVDVFVKEMCRKIPLKFQEETTIMNGEYPVYRYTVPENAFGHPAVNNPENQGYCTDDGCPPHGLANLTQCAFGTPIFASLPHFLGADPALREAVSGISPPKEELHQSIVDFNPYMGFTMQGFNRIQTNVQVQKSFGMTELGMFEDDVILPVFWMEAGAKIENQPEYVIKLFDEAALAPKLELIIGFGSILMMPITFLGICLVLSRNRRNKIHADYNTSLESISS